MTAADEPLDGKGLHVAVVAARYHADVVERLLEGALSVLHEAGVDAVSVDRVPGAFELPLGAQARAETGAVDAVVTLGCVVRGETPHFDYVCDAAARGVMDVMLETGVPIAFGVLTTESLEQAHERAGGTVGNKGEEAARTALEMAALLRHADEHSESAPTDLG